MGGRTNLKTSLLMAIFLAAMAYGIASGKVVYVDDDGSLPGDGKSWATAFKYLRNGLGDAHSGDVIRVAEGTYKPTDYNQPPLPPPPPPPPGSSNGQDIAAMSDDRTATFHLRNGVVIEGGYAGLGEPDPNARDIELYETILSGDIGMPGDISDNSYHVVTGSWTYSTAVLDGFTITGGNANVGPDIPVGMISHWKFDEGQGSIAYDSARNNHGIVYGAQWTNGQLGGALDFDAFNDYVDCGNNASLDITAKVTITVWVKTNDAGNFQHNPYVAKGDRSYAIKHYMDNSLQFFIYDGEWKVAWFPVDGSFNGVWHHLAGTYDGSSLKLYVDGQLRNTCAHVGSIASSGFSVNIGRNAQATDRFYDGLLDEVAIYNRALSAGEIQGLYSMGEDRNYDGLLDEVAIYNSALSASESQGLYSMGEVRDCGGGMYNDNGNPTLNNCTFTGNFAARDGGGMFNSERSNPTLIGCTFRGNRSIYEGGAISNRTSSPTITNCSFIDNSSNHGGGISSWPGSPVVSDCTFSGNSAELGGAVFNYDSSSTLTNCMFSNNYAEELGGAICNLSTIVPLVQDNSGPLGGGTNIANSIPLFADYTFSDNSSGYESSVSSASDSSTLANCTFSGNSAELGGAVFNYDSSSTLTNCVFNSNSAYAGGGVCYIGESNPSLDNCTFGGNSAQIGGGLVGSECSFTLTNCTFTGNSAEIGGGLVGIQGTSTLTNCTFTGNSAEIGGGLVGAGSAMTITNCMFSGNSGEYYGGAFYNESGSATIINCIFSENTCGLYGGAINEAFSSASSLYNCLFSGNSCSLHGGALHYWYESRPNLFNCTFAGNSAPNGNAIACSTPEGYEGVPPSTVRALNCIFWDGGGEIFNNNNSFITINYSDVQGGWLGAGNINANPLFVDSAIGDYHLLYISPCINAGDPAYPVGPNETDLDGKPRVIRDRIDMGAYEFNYIPVADAGPDQTVEAQAPWGATVTLDGSGSSDADSTPGTNDDISDFVWNKVDPFDPNADVFLGSGRIIDCNLSFGEHIIILEVIDRAGAFDVDDVAVVIQDTTPPVFTTIPQDLTVECDGNYNVAELNAWLAGVAAVDKCGSVTITNDFVGILNKCGATGSATVTWTAEDESGSTATTPPATFTIVDTTSPVIICPADVTLECPADTSVEANGSATASDTCGTVTITHSDQWQPSCGSVGTLTRTWTATDECGNSSSCVQTITVVDTTPPEFEFSVTPAVLWPPSHKMVKITPSWTVSDKCDETPDVSLVSISVNEADDAKGAGHTSDDIRVDDDGSIYLRAERSGTGNDRIYTITYRAADDCGNAAVRSATVTVPHDQR